jgi:hypothetical protein
MLDTLLTFSVKSALRVFCYYKSSNWEQTTARVTGQMVLDPIFGCPSVKLHYKFDYAGRSTKGSDLIPFPGTPQAKMYATSFTHNMMRIIRVNPKNPQETRFFEHDQNSSVTGV